MKKAIRWMRLDNAAKIFPAIIRKNWNNVFRVSACLTEAVDPQVLQQALEQVLPRFPSMAVRLRRGVFWFYLEELPEPPQVRPEGSYPLVQMSWKELKTCCLRVLYRQNRIAVECFHALTDGSGGMIFLKTLTAAYLTRKYGVVIPAGEGVLPLDQPPQPEELEDSFLRCAAPAPLSRAETNAYHYRGDPLPEGFRALTTGLTSTSALHAMAKGYGVTVTAFLSGVMLQTLIELQQAAGGREKEVKVTLPVNLRRLYGSRTLRNFALTVNLGVDPKLGPYTLEELCRSVHHQLAAEVTPQRMAGRIAANVLPEQNQLLKLCPLFIKNIAMRQVYRSVGERKGSLNISNLGLQRLPAPMEAYVTRLDFVIGVQLSYSNNCSVVSYGDVTAINFIRAIRQSELERRFFTHLVELGLPVTVESNQPRDGRRRG